jgi:deazaflavin-dependent oxidoreductase (nitroreductase family)
MDADQCSLSGARGCERVRAARFLAERVQLRHIRVPTSEKNMSAQSSTPQLGALAIAAMRAQVWLLRHGLMGSLADEIMVITVTGRKTGRQYSTPIGYLRDGETIIALSRGSNWYKNAVATGRAQIEIKQQRMNVRVEAVTDQAERARIFAPYQRDRAKNFARLFGVPVDAPEAELQQALAMRDFVKMTPVR